MKPKGIVWAMGLTAAIIAATYTTSEPRQSATTTNALGMQFVKIAPGTFQMGCSPGDSECDDNEKPVHTVRITKAFEFGKYEVTRKEWTAVMGWNRCDHEPVGYPACVTWNDAARFIVKMNDRKDGYRYRLPTEAEWEYAARAGTTTKYGGPKEVVDVGWYYSHTPPTNYGKHPGGQKKPNAWGLYDMLGNVSEWVQDWYDDYGATAMTDPKGPPTGSMKVLRGGDFNSFAASLRVTSRLPLTTSHMHTGTGFRVARDVAPAPPAAKPAPGNRP